MKAILTVLFFSITNLAIPQQVGDTVYPVRTELITPLHKESFNNNGACKERKQGGNARQINGYEVFDASMDGNRQVDPQIAVGGGYILHGTNGGLIIYNKKGEFIQGVSQKCFNDGIDPKIFFDIFNRVFVFDLWWYYDKEKIKPVNIAVSEMDDPTKAWNTYPVPAPNGVDGGGIGYSRKWIGYSFPGGDEETFILKTAEAKAGKPATVYHFKGSLGHPVFVQDNIDELYFFEINETDIIIKKITSNANDEPMCITQAIVPHHLVYNEQPEQSQQKGTSQRVSSGDRNPKVIVLQNGAIWFSHVVAYKDHSAVQWHQVNAATGRIIQSGLIKDDLRSYIQTTLTVNKNEDVLVGFQITDSTSFISPAFAYRSGKDAPGTISDVMVMGAGKAATDGVSWGDYSGSIIDGDNLADQWTIQSIANEKGKGETMVIKVPAKKKRHK